MGREGVNLALPGLIHLSLNPQWEQKLGYTAQNSTPKGTYPLYQHEKKDQTGIEKGIFSFLVPFPLQILSDPFLHRTPEWLRLDGTSRGHWVQIIAQAWSPTAVPRAVSKNLSNISREGDSTTPLGTGLCPHNEPDAVAGCRPPPPPPFLPFFCIAV